MRKQASYFISSDANIKKKMLPNKKFHRMTNLKTKLENRRPQYQNAVSSKRENSKDRSVPAGVINYITHVSRDPEKKMVIKISNLVRIFPQTCLFVIGSEQCPHFED